MFGSRGGWTVVPVTPVDEDEDDRQVNSPSRGAPDRKARERTWSRSPRPASATHGHAGRRGDGVLFGDADIEESIGKLACELS